VKRAFSTLGCPEWSLTRVIEAARAWGYDGVDFRGLEGETDLWKHPAFSTRKEETRRLLEEAGVEISCFSTSIRLLHGPEKEERFIREAEAYASLASFFRVLRLRVFGGYLREAGTPDKEEGAERAASFLDRIAERVGPGVRVLVETHDDWMRGKDIAMILSRCRAPNTGVVWDVHHPFRIKGETIEETWKAAGRWVEYVHLKDSREEDGGYRLCLPGEGSVPIEEAVALLRRNAYEGYLAFEWEKKWHPDIEEPETAFPAFTAYMNAVEAASGTGDPPP